MTVACRSDGHARGLWRALTPQMFRYGRAAAALDPARSRRAVVPMKPRRLRCWDCGRGSHRSARTTSRSRAGGYVTRRTHSRGARTDERYLLGSVKGTMCMRSRMAITSPSGASGSHTRMECARIPMAMCCCMRYAMRSWALRRSAISACISRYRSPLARRGQSCVPATRSRAARWKRFRDRKRRCHGARGGSAARKHRETMRANIAADLAIDLGRVNVKATTSEGLGIRRAQGRDCVSGDRADREERDFASCAFEF